MHTNRDDRLPILIHMRPGRTRVARSLAVVLAVGLAAVANAQGVESESAEAAASRAKFESIAWARVR